MGIPLASDDVLVHGNCQLSDLYFRNHDIPNDISMIFS